MKRLRLIASIVIVLLAGWLALYLFQNREPRYQGRMLTEWLDDYRLALASQTETETSRRAVKRIGTNAIPFYLKELCARDSALDQRMKTWLRRQSLIRFNFKDAWQHRLQGLEGFVILEKDALCAVPALEELARDPDSDIRYNALSALGVINPKRDVMLPILLQCIHDPIANIRELAAIRLHRLYPEEAEKAGVYKKFPGLKHSDPDNNLPHK
jgi:hypothetical protein